MDNWMDLKRKEPRDNEERHSFRFGWQTSLIKGTGLTELKADHIELDNRAGRPVGNPR